MPSETNNQLVLIFREMAAIYKYMGETERFRSLSYSKAAKVIGGLKDDVLVYIKNNTLEDLPGIGESIAEKIKEFIKTGTIKKYEQLKKTTPHELIEMIDIRGFGPQSLKQIHQELQVSTKAQLIKALQENQIEKLKGFGKKKVEGMRRGLKLHKVLEDRMLLWNALNISDEIVERLKQMPEVKQVEVAGSLRRKTETIGDIDILASSEEPHRKKIINHFVNSSFVKEVLVKGNTKVSIILKSSNKQVDLRIVNEDEWGSALQYFTGSKEHNIHLRTIAKENGFKISEYGVFKIDIGKKIAGKTEEEVYKKLGFQMIPPEMREDKGELELAKKHTIPKLISIDDIKGDLHLHSVWSDGTHSLEDIVKFITKNYSYEYIAITDHSQASRIANGMDEKQLLKQIKAVELINKKNGNQFLKTGIEVDILPNGKLDISDEILSQLDWVTASIHSGFTKDNTDRIIKACENSNVCCIGHPTGRLIGSREPYKIDLNEVITIAKHTHTALEINAQPERMDLKDDFAMAAREKGVKLVISTDSHSPSDFNFMKLGIYIAKRAWCTPDDVLNTLSWTEIEKWKRLKRKLVTN
jgi:DNA polymerase (family 10)